MSFDGYLCLGGRTLINMGQTSQFIADGRGPEGLQCRNCGPCPDIDAGLGFPSGYNPSESEWFNGTEESVDFAGLLVTSITGLDPGIFTRPVTETSGVGAVIGQGRQSAPNIVVTGLLMAATCCAQDYGLAWLRNALRGQCGGTLGCGGEDLVFLACEPQTPDLDCPENDPFDYEAWLSPYFRTMKGVALIDGPRVEVVPRACADCYDCGILQVTFTLAAAKPCVYRDPINVLEFGSFVCGEVGEDCIEWVEDGDCDPDEVEGCGVPDDCSADPDCPPSAAPPTVPGITNPCVEDCIAATTCTVCVDIPAGTFPSTGDGTLIVTVHSGSAPLKRIKLRVWSNPLDFDPELLSECDVCAELNISYLAPFSTLIIDGTTGTATIQCPGGSSIRANPYIASATGSPVFTYPSLDGCSGQFTACVTTAPGAALDAFVSIDAVGRNC